MGFIYRITNIENKKVYIGQTKQDDPMKRWKEHQRSVKYKCGCPALKNAIKHYGIEKFKFEVVIICFDDDVDKFEIEYIKKYNCIAPNGYNINEGGEIGGMFKGCVHSKESKQLISQQNYKRFSTIESRREHGENIKKSEKWKAAMAERRVMPKKGNGKKISHSDEHRKKLSESLKKYYATNDNDSKISSDAKANLSKKMTEINGKSVSQYTSDGTFINTYPSIAYGAKQNGLQRKAVQACVSGRTKTSGGFVWKYAANKET
jgi:group I intron endonuclease